MLEATSVELEVLEEKMPESPWHNENVRQLEDLLREAVKNLPNAVVFRDLFFRFGGKQYAPDLAVVVGRTPPFESIGLVYRVPEDGDAPSAIVEVAVSPKSLGEALSEKAEFYADMGVKDYLVVQAFPQKPVRLWFCRLNMGEMPTQVGEAKLETLGITVKAEGSTLRVFDPHGKAVLPPRSHVSLLQEELERTKALLEEERRKREELERRVAELERKLEGRSC